MSLISKETLGLSLSSFILSNVTITTISTDDFYNCLYWDHRIYDLRPKEDYARSHICRSHNISPLPVVTTDVIALIDAKIDDEYGKAENPSDVLICTNDKAHYDDCALQSEILNSLLSYLTSTRNPSNKFLKRVHILDHGYEHFHLIFSFLCSDSIHYSECSRLVWPSCITPNLYLGSAMCRNETVVSMLKITHILSFSDFPEKKIQLTNVETLHWKISDSLSAKLVSVFPVVVAWISKAINNDNGIVLVHRDQGVSRSASVVIAYLLHSDINFPSVDVALNYVKSKRPNPSFLQQLEEYSINIRNTNQTMEVQNDNIPVR